MSRARELAKVGGKNQQVISGLSSHVGVSTFLDNVHMFANLDVGGNVVVTGTTTFNGGTLTLGDANTDNIVFGGEVDSNIVPDDDGSFDLGSSTKEWKDLFIDGTAHIDTLDVDENAAVAGNLNVTGTATFSTALANSNLANSTVSYGGVTLALGASDATPAFDLQDATGYPTSSLVGTITNAQLAGSIANAKLTNSTVSYGGISLALGGTDATPAFDLTDATNYPTSSLTGTITNAQLAGSIASGKLASTGVSAGTVGSSTAIPIITVNAQGQITNTSTTAIDSTTIENGSASVAVAENGPITSTGNHDFTAGIDVTGAGNFANNVAVSGNFDVDGATTLDGLTVAENATFSAAIDVDGHTNLDNVSVAGVSTFTGATTFTGAIDANGGASIDNVQVGVTNDNEIDTSSGNLVIDSAGGTVTVDDNLTVSGNLTVNGTTTTINSTTVAIDDKNFQVATGAADDAAADGAGLTVDSGDGDKTFNFEATGDNWGASENLNLASGKVYKINNSSILSATALGSSVVSSSLTSVGTIASGVWQGTAIGNAYLANSTVSFGGITLSLGGTDATPAFDLSDATNYPTSSLSGTITNAQLAGSIAASKLAGSIGNAKLSNSSVSYGGVTLALGASDATPAFDLSDATDYPTSSLVGTITNAQLAGSIASGKLASTGVSAGTVGSSTAIPIITVNAQGQITNTSTTAIDSTTIENGTASVAVASNGPITSTGNHDFTAGIDVTGNITVTGTVDGADVASMNSKLSGIEDNATRDQTASEILALIKSVDGPGSGLNADTLDGISSASFLRSDTSDTMSGTLTMNGNILPNANGTRDLGASGTRWANIYTSDVDLNNQAKGGNTIDGSWGSYLIEEGENDLFLKNRRSGKTYKFMLQEV